MALELLRHHKDLLKATLEAYIHDPLIDWNRTNPGHKQQQIENVRFPPIFSSPSMDDMASTYRKIRTETRERHSKASRTA